MRLSAARRCDEPLHDMLFFPAYLHLADSRFDEGRNVNKLINIRCCNLTNLYSCDTMCWWSQAMWRAHSSLSASATEMIDSRRARQPHLEPQFTSHAAHRHRAAVFSTYNVVQIKAKKSVFRTATVLNYHHSASVLKVTYDNIWSRAPKDGRCCLA